MLGDVSDSLRHVESNVRDRVFCQFEQSRANDCIIEVSAHFSVQLVDLVDGHDAHHKLIMLHELFNLISEDALQPFFREGLLAQFD